jgi:hypothetical protein
MSVANRSIFAVAFSATAFLASFGAAMAQASPPAYQGCKAGDLVILRQEETNASGVTVAIHYVTLRCDGWDWVSAT